MPSRLDLQALLVSVLGSNHVYFQPPPSLTMQYPCIVYRRDDMNHRHADNKPYTIEKRYSVTVIDRDPDSAIPDSIALLPKCTFNRSFTVDNLYHDVYNLFF